jgi:hypothetical protein
LCLFSLYLICHVIFVCKSSFTSWACYKWSFWCNYMIGPCFILFIVYMSLIFNNFNSSNQTKLCINLQDEFIDINVSTRLAKKWIYVVWTTISSLTHFLFCILLNIIHVLVVFNLDKLIMWTFGLWKWQFVNIFFLWSSECIVPNFKTSSNNLFVVPNTIFGGVLNNFDVLDKNTLWSTFLKSHCSFFQIWHVLLHSSPNERWKR